jgi:hypothetical protein
VDTGSAYSLMMRDESIRMWMLQSTSHPPFLQVAILEKNNETPFAAAFEVST